MSTYKIFIAFKYGMLMGAAMMFLVKTKDSFIVSPVVVEKYSSQEDTKFQTIDSPVEVGKFSSQEDTKFQTCLDPSGPMPVVLMSIGRSGSDSTWQLLANRFGADMMAKEITGQYRDASISFFRLLDGAGGEGVEKLSKNVANYERPANAKDWQGDDLFGFIQDLKGYCDAGNCKDGKWILKHFCHQQQKHKETGGIVGFKWKPFMTALQTASALGALEIIARSSVSETPIRVIRSRRNPLDVYLSMLKHSTQNIADHCDAGDEECLKQHRSVRLTVPVNEMYDFVKSMCSEENEVDGLLSQLGVMAIHVSYDDLYYPESEEVGAEDWNKMFKFLGARENWAWSDIVGTMKLAPTVKSRSHKVVIANYDEVYQKFKGTKLEMLLRQGD
jgi:hypothetical protein